jgi:hypothetical protein
MAAGQLPMAYTSQTISAADGCFGHLVLLVVQNWKVCRSGDGWPGMLQLTSGKPMQAMMQLWIWFAPAKTGASSMLLQLRLG